MLNEGNTTETPATPKPIGGWLYLVGLGVFVGPLYLGIQLLSNLKEINNGTWSKLIFKSSEYYHPIYFPTLTLELFACVVLFVAQLVQIYLFLKKDKRFPEVYSFVLLLSAISSSFIYFSVSSYPAPDKAVLKTLFTTMIQSIGSAVIWITYMFNSKRVKETFIRDYNTLPFLNLHRTFVIPLLIVSIFFGWSYLNRSPKSEVARNNHEAKKPEPPAKELSSKEIAAIALENLVVIEPIGKDGKIFGIGSGFFILPNVIATNAHVIENAHSIQIRYPNSQKTDTASQIIAIDSTTDIALIRTTDFTAAAPLKLGNADKVSIGSTIYTVGNPQGLEGTFTDGLLSNRQRMRGVEILQISAPISQGSSGGPVLDSSGSVIGVSTAYIKRGQNLNLAIPSVYISRLVMRSEDFYPLAKNSELKENGSIASLFPQVCSYLVDVDLPEKYFIEISDKDLQGEEMKEMCAQAMPTCKKAWLNKVSKGAVLVGSHELSTAKLENVSRDDFEKITTYIIAETKKAYRKSAPDVQFKVSTKDINQHTYRLDIESEYTSEEKDYTDYRSMYFVLPYCRLDVLYSSSGGKKELDGAVYRILNENFIRVLPGSQAEKALFTFEK